MGTKFVNRLFELSECHMIDSDKSTIWYNSDVINNMEFIQAHELYSADEPVTEQIIRREINRFTKWCADNKLHLIGYMPWKLFKSDILLEEPEPGWVEKIKEPCQKFLDTIDKLKAAEDPEEAFNTMFTVGSNASAEEYVDEVYYHGDVSGDADG